MDLSDSKKDELICILTNELRVLRAKMEISQHDLADRIGITRQTLGMIEKKKHRMTWNHFMALLFVFKSNDGSSEILDRIGAYPDELDRYIKLSDGERS